MLASASRVTAAAAAATRCARPRAPTSECRQMSTRQPQAFCAACSRAFRPRNDSLAPRQAGGPIVIARTVLKRV